MTNHVLEDMGVGIRCKRILRKQTKMTNHILEHRLVIQVYIQDMGIGVSSKRISEIRQK